MGTGEKSREHRVSRVLREAAFAVAIGLLGWPLVGPLRGATAAPADAVVKANPVRIRMASPDSISPTSFTKLIDAMYGAPARTVISNSRLGSGLARSRIVDAYGDGKLTGTEERFILSGAPFTAAETAELTTANATLIRAPVHATHNAILSSNVFKTERAPDEDQYSAPGPPLVLDGPHPTVKASMFKMPWSALGAHYFELRPGESWLNPEVLTAWGLVRNPTDGNWYPPGTSDFYFVTFGGSIPMFTARYEPSAANLYLLTALSKLAPDPWKAYVKQTSAAGPGESFLGGSQTTIRARGVGSLTQYLADPLTAIRNNRVGTMGPAPLWAVPQLRTSYPDFDGTLWVSELQNGSNEWIAPTGDSVTKAIAAGGDTPLYALNNPVPGAYPLSWVDSLYAPATGLSIDETNAVAAFIRYLVTDGQDVVKADEDGVIGPDLVAKALAAANTAVTSNCAAAQGVARLEPDSPYYPVAADAPKLHALAPQLVCATPPDPSTTTTTATTATTIEAATTTTTAAATTTTTEAATTTTRVASTTRATTTTTRAARTTAATVLSATTQATVPTTVATTKPRPTPTTLPDDQIVGAPLAPTVESLPLGLPPTGRAGFDRWTTMLLGGIVAYRVRNRFMRRVVA
jgi:hypothetical protein